MRSVAIRASFCCTSWNCAERLPELLALLDVRERLAERASRHAAGRGGHGGPQPVERREAESVAAPLGAEQRVRRNPAILEGDLAQRMRRAQHLRRRRTEARACRPARESS